MYVYMFLAYVSGFQTLVHITWNHLEGLLKYRLLGPAQRVSYSVGLGWGLRICFSNKCTATDSISLGITF